MKKRLYFAACVAALTIAGCKEHVEDEPLTDDMVQLTVDVTSPETKITGTYDDMKVNEVQLFVFDKFGTLEATAFAESRSVSVRCRNGEKHIVALVTAGELTNVKTLDELAHRKVDLADMSEGNEVMVGSKLDTLKTNRLISVNVERIAAKIVFSQVGVSFANPLYAGKEVTLKALYLVNAAGERCYMADDPATFWYNDGGYQKDNCPSVIYDAIDNEVVTSGMYTRYKEHYFYCYPNGIDKQTRLVLETEIDGSTFYYPINMGVIEPGHSYKCYLTIRNLGSYSPDVPVEEYTANSVVKVSPWVLEDTFGVEI